MANKGFDRTIFGQKINAPKKNVRAPIDATAVTEMNAIAALCENVLDSSFTEDDVKDGYRNILMVLGKEDGVSQLSIAKNTNLKPSTVSIALKKMERDGYITRVNDLKDMRMSRVYLTEKGMEIADRAYKTNSDIEKILLAGISEEELKTVMNVIAQMKKNYSESEYAKETQNT